MPDIAGESCDCASLICAVMRMLRGAKNWAFHSERTAWMVRRRDGSDVLPGVGGEFLAGSRGVLVSGDLLLLCVYWLAEVWKGLGTRSAGRSWRAINAGRLPSKCDKTTYSRTTSLLADTMKWKQVI